MNIPLKIALMRAGMRQIDVARRTGLGESTISRIINDYREPTAEERGRRLTPGVTSDRGAELSTGRGFERSRHYFGLWISMI